VRSLWFKFAVVIVVLLVGAPPVPAQRPAGRLPTVAVLWAGPIEFARPYLSAGLEAMRELGWVEGQNFTVDYRFAPPTAKSQPEYMAALAANAQEAVRNKVDVIVACADPAVEAARSVTSTIPIVMIAVGDAVALGFVSSIARPGGNITGIGALSSELSGKRLELLKQIIPNAKNMAVLWNPGNPAGILGFRDIDATAKKLNVTMHSIPVRTEAEIPTAFATMAQEKSEGLTVVTDPLTWLNRRQIIELAAKNRLPAVYELREYVDIGGLVSYGPSLAGLSRRVAFFVDRIFKGASPATLPVELPTQLEMVVNTKAAAGLGLTIPQPVLLRTNDTVK